MSGQKNKENMENVKETEISEDTKVDCSSCSKVSENKGNNRTKFPEDHYYEGAYGIVSLYPERGQAVKVFSDWLDDTYPTADFIREMMMYRALRGTRCSPELLGINFQDKSMTFELADDTLRSQRIFHKVKAFHDIVHIFRNFKEIGVIHSDVKPSNLVYEIKDGVTIGKVLDFGIVHLDYTREWKKPKDVIMAYTRWYRPPEVLCYNLALREVGLYTYKADIFALGVSMFDIFTGKRLFPGKDDISQGMLYLIACDSPENPTRPERKERKEHSKRKFTKNCLKSLVTGPSRRRELFNYMANKAGTGPTKLFDLLSMMLEPNPNHRIDYDQILSHRFFSRLDKSPKVGINLGVKASQPRLESIEPYLWERSYLFEWITKLCYEHSFTYEVLFTAYTILDIVLGRINLLDKDMMRYAVMSLHVASCMMTEDVQTEKYEKELKHWYKKELLSDACLHITKIIQNDILTENVFTHIMRGWRRDYPILGKTIKESEMRRILQVLIRQYFSGLVYSTSYEQKAYDILVDNCTLSQLSKTEERRYRHVLIKLRLI